MIRRQLLTGLLMTVAMIVLVGVIFPLTVTGVAQVLFMEKANGSLVRNADGKIVGSSLIGQSFADKDGSPLPQYLQPRPSKAGDGYDALASSASNLAPSNAKLIGNVPGVAYDSDGNQIKHNPYATKADPYCVPLDGRVENGKWTCDPNTIPQRALAYRAFNGLTAGVTVPSDAVTASASGLDPQISVANARLQAPRIAKARNLSVGQVQKVIDSLTASRQLGFLGEQTVNVLEVNLALDKLKS